jgi:DNA (cytosine-5)-methyltransferase 1
MGSTLDEPLVIGGTAAATANGVDGVVGDEIGVRRITPLEGERLQGFPDGWTDADIADSARYRALGNAVAVPVVAWIAKRLVEVDERVESGIG